ncbi:MAG: cupin domain-containing protein [Pseudomonadota bacterium]
MDIFWGDISLEQFLSEYWQKKPLLMRGALPSFQTPISPDELAGLSTEEGTTSRLVIRKTLSDWEVRYGPFENEEFSKLPTENFTLLVQEVECYSQEVLQLKRKFRFLPDWRMDDVMVSYAANGGGVGPHVDYYDVFLVQAMGRRHWKIGKLLDHEPEYREDLDLRIMKEFHPVEDWILEPGDILYLPPMVPHDGVAIGEAMTFSMGFRSPAYDEMLAAWSRSIGVDMLENQRFHGGQWKPTSKPGEITYEAVKEVIQILNSFPKEPTDVAKWFGRLVTYPKRGEPSAELTELLKNGVPSEELRLFAESFRDDIFYEWNEQIRLAYYHLEDALLCFVDGELFELHHSFTPMMELLSGEREFGVKEFKAWAKIEGAHELLAAFASCGMIHVNLPE